MDYKTQRDKINKCAAIQMVSVSNVNSNLLEAEKLIAQATRAGAKLITLPENFALMGESDSDKVKIREPDGAGRIQKFLAESAKKHDVWLVGGTVPLISDDNNKIRASCLVYNNQGIRVARYDKVHLFDVSVPETNEEYRESDYIEKGNKSLVIDTPFGKLGLAICYDLRFPEFFRKLLDQGMEIMVIPSAFTAETGRAHWEVLLRTRAIENLCYIVAPNQGGLHFNRRETFGHSMIVDPWGVVMGCHKNNIGFVCAEIDQNRLQKIRTTFPVLKHRQYYCA